MHIVDALMQEGRVSPFPFCVPSWCGHVSTTSHCISLNCILTCGYEDVIAISAALLTGAVAVAACVMSCIAAVC
jgi:hypothetical protein